MRIGKWVPLYKRILPLPQRLGLAFGLTEGSELHLAPILDVEARHKFGCEVIVSPVPTQSWRSACRLSVRLQDRPKALATATNFMRMRRINILLSESCNTYQYRAHWDAICDLSETAGFSALIDPQRTSYERVMQNYLDTLTTQLQEFIENPINRDYFLQGQEKHAQFSPLTGLNDASFACDFANSVRLQYRAGGIEIPEKLANQISAYCLMDVPALPEYAMITGNTEQRYLRVLFLKDYHHMFQLVVRNDLQNFAGGGVGVLHQFLSALPKQINLIKTSNYIIEKRNDIEKGHIEIIGHWDLSDMSANREAKRSYMASELKRLVSSLELEDAEGKKHSSTLSVVDFSGPDIVYPRVFISYSTHHEKEKLEYLRNTLWENHFQPVLGTDLGQFGQEASLAGHHVTSDVLQSAFQLIPGCVALISLQVKRDDFKVINPRNKKHPLRYILPPWSIAEEVFAWSSNVGLIIRLKDTLIEDPRYNRNTLTMTFSSDEDYEEAVDSVINELNSFRLSPRFNQIKTEARLAQYKQSHPPIDV